MGIEYNQEVEEDKEEEEEEVSCSIGMYLLVCWSSARVRSDLHTRPSWSEGK